ncbi:MAG: hypothetical protein ACI8YQ_001727 [Polaribacter sp.]|jgi:hypothetical protein
MRRNNLVRLLLMFGPMIYNGVTRFLNNRKRQQQMAPPQPRPSQEDDFTDYDDEKPEVEKPTYREDDMV